MKGYEYIFCNSDVFCSYKMTLFSEPSVIKSKVNASFLLPRKLVTEVRNGGSRRRENKKDESK
jgi:hypothetical protein